MRTLTSQPFHLKCSSHSQPALILESTTNMIHQPVCKCTQETQPVLWMKFSFPHSAAGSSWKQQSSSPISVFCLVNISVILFHTPSHLLGWEWKQLWGSTSLWVVKNMLNIRYITSLNHFHQIAYMLKTKHLVQCFAGTGTVLSDAWKLTDPSLSVSIGSGSHLVSWYLHCTMWCQRGPFLAQFHTWAKLWQ